MAGEAVMKGKPISMLLVMLTAWMNRHQQDVIEYLKEENKILREKLGGKRILLNDDQRIRLMRLPEICVSFVSVATGRSLLAPLVTHLYTTYTPRL